MNNIKKIMMGLAAGVVLTGVANASPVGVYINDDFNGSTLDTSTWNSAGLVTVGPPDSAAGTVLLNANHGVFTYINSVASVTPGAGQTAILQGTGLSSPVYEEGLGFGFYNLDNQNYILLGESGSTNTLSLQISAAGGAQQRSAEFAFGGFNGDFTIAWDPTKVVVSSGSTVLFDTSVTGTAGGGSWVLPTAAISANAFTYINSYTLTMDSVNLQVVPEPSAVAMAFFGGIALLYLGRRKRLSI